MQKYQLEFILNTRGAKTTSIRNSLVEFGENLEITPLAPENVCVCAGAPGGVSDTGKPVSGNGLKIKIETHDPTIIFDICAEFGKLKSVKIN